MPELSDLTIYALVSTAAATSLLHTLIPDHWLPFVLIGRAQSWTAGTVGAVSGLSALIHAVLSVGLGLMALGLGQTTATAIGERLESVAAILLIAFGLIYAFWAWRKGGHFHPGGDLLHRHHGDAACEGSEGDANPDHFHYHADDGLIRGRAGWGAVWLAVIIGINPCVLVLPLMLYSVPRGPSAVALVTLAYVVPTVILMVGLSVIGVATPWRIPVPWVARYAEMVSGLLIALAGAAFWVFEHH